MTHTFPINYRNMWTIDSKDETGMYIAYPTEEGIQHDYDQDGDSTRYMGNCLWSTGVDDLMDEIDEKIITEQDSQIIDLESTVKYLEGKTEGQEQLIDKLKCALELSNACMRGYNRTTVDLGMDEIKVFTDQIKENEEILNHK